MLPPLERRRYLPPRVDPHPTVGAACRMLSESRHRTVRSPRLLFLTNGPARHGLAPRGPALCGLCQGYIDSTKYQLINYNVSREGLPAAIKITPGKKSPSILPLERGDWVAVHAMVLRKAVPEIIDQLIAIGATDVLVFSLANCRV